MILGQPLLKAGMVLSRIFGTHLCKHSAGPPLNARWILASVCMKWDFRQALKILRIQCESRARKCTA